MAECVKTSTPLEQYVLLAKGTKGAAAVGLIKQVLEAPGVYVFGELLEMPNIQEVNSFKFNFWQYLGLFTPPPTPPPPKKKDEKKRKSTIILKFEIYMKKLYYPKRLMVKP